MDPEYDDLDDVDTDENRRTLKAILAARDRGDLETANELYRNLVVPANALVALLHTAGPDWIRREGPRTETAERKYGEDWLDATFEIAPPSHPEVYIRATATKATGSSTSPISRAPRRAHTPGADSTGLIDEIHRLLSMEQTASKIAARRTEPKAKD